MYIQNIGSLGAVAKKQLRSEYLAFLCKPISYFMGITVTLNDHGGHIYIFYIAYGINLSIHAKNWVSFCFCLHVPYGDLY